MKERVDLINSAASGKGCRELAKEFKIEKTQASDILDDNRELRHRWHILEVLNGF